jgi:acyl-coenzyme A synthetase/AMP-(fatty) acid ligase
MPTCRDDATGARVALALNLAGEPPLYDEIVESLLGYGLARGKLPEEIIFWNEPLPRNASGKIVRAQLRDQADSKAAVLAPRLAASAKDS